MRFPASAEASQTSVRRDAEGIAEEGLVAAPVRNRPHILKTPEAHHDAEEKQDDRRQPEAWQLLRQQAQNQIGQGKADAYGRQIREPLRQQRKAEQTNIQAGEQRHRLPRDQKAQNRLALAQRACRDQNE